MAVVHALYYTDPACPWSWAAEPARLRLEYEFGEQLRFTYVMAGRARTIDRPLEELAAWLDASAESGMPIDPRLWLQAPPSSSYPACMAVKAAAEQDLDGPMLRVLRHGFAYQQRRLDSPDALLAAAREVRGLDVERFRVDLGSHAILEAFGADLDRARALEPAAGKVAPTTPVMTFTGDPRDETQRASVEPGRWREAAIAAGAAPSTAGVPDVVTALRELGPLATAEVAAVCDLPGPRAQAELWGLAVQWRVRPQRLLAGELWHPP